MANGPKYRVPFRRRMEGKTNYHRRLKLVLSRRNRLVIRSTNKHTVVQVFESLIQGDKIKAQSHTNQLEKEFQWVYNTGNLPSAYLAGYLCGLRAKKSKVGDAILDVGILVHDERIKAAFKGFVDAGIEVPHDEKWFSEKMQNRVSGNHIEEYAKKLSKDDAKKYKKLFSTVIKKSGDPKKITSSFKETKKTMESKV